MSKPRYKLTYFDRRGKAEVSRLIFAYTGVHYEDYRIEPYQVNRTPFEALKPQLPFGQLPILEFDGVKLCQSKAIARHLANEYGLVGRSPVERARCDALVDCFEDVLKPASVITKDIEEKRKKELVRKFIEEQSPYFLTLLEKLLQENNGGDGFFVGDSLTWTDLAFLMEVDNISYYVPEFRDELEKYAKLSALKRRVESLPKIAEWIAKRPVTVY